MQTISNRKNAVAAHMRKLGADRGYRASSGEFLCDGRKLLYEAVKWDAAITAVLYEGNEPEGLPAGVAAYRADRSVMEAVSPMKTPQDVLFSCRMPQKSKEITGGSAIILENLQDPGNVGTVIRTANAFGAGTVVLCGETADPYNPKTLRASMGAIFRQHTACIAITDLREAVSAAGLELIGADVGEGCTDIRALKADKWAVAIGSEGRGLSDEMKAICARRITIPMAEACESLNAAVAASLIIWELSKNCL